MTTPTCWHCQHSIKHYAASGSREEPPEGAWAECELTDVPAVLIINEMFGEESPAHGCPRFEPIVVRVCAHCGGVIEQPVHTHPTHLWIDIGFDPIAVCSSACREMIIEEIKREVFDGELP